MPRKHERSTFLTEIVLESASGKRQARISDVSEGGCFVETITTARPGEEVTISGKLDGAWDFSLTGKVAYVLDGLGFGMQFDELSDEAKMIIYKILNK